MEAAKHTPGPWPEFKENGEPQRDANFSFEESDYPGEFFRFVQMRLPDYNFARIVISERDALKSSLRDILSRFKSCIAQGNGEIEGDKEAIAEAEKLSA
jgi:hypothetical protein